MRSPCRFRDRAFSLVEVLLALGVVSFALVSLLGLVPVGLSTFHQAMNLNARALIFQGLASETQLLDYSAATNLSSTFSQSFPRYFDNAGAPLASGAGASFSVSVSRAGFAAPGGTASSASAQCIGFTLTNLTSHDKGSSYSVLVVNNGS